MPDFRLQPSFPIASVIDAAQRNNALQQQALQAGNQSLVQGLGAIGQVAQSLVQRRQMMAQALAGAQMYAQTPEGQDMLAPKSLTETQTLPVPASQTAQGTDDQGNILPAPIPNAGQAGAITTRQQTKTTTTPSGVTPQTLATAFMGESPSNMLTQLFERQKQRQQFGLEMQKQAFNEKMEPIKLAQQAQLTQALTGVKSQQVSNEAQANIRNQITALEGKKAQYIKDFPELTGTFLQGVLPKGSNAKEEAAFNDYQETQRQINNYNRQLYGGGAPSDSPIKHMSTADLLAIVNQSK